MEKNRVISPSLDNTYILKIFKKIKEAKRSKKKKNNTVTIVRKICHFDEPRSHKYKLKCTRYNIILRFVMFFFCL